MATTTHFPVQTGMTPRSKNSTALSLRGKDGTLPEIRTSNNQIDKTKPLPTSLQSEFLPDEVLLAITQPPPQFDKLGPPSRYRNIDTSAGITKKKPAGVWTHGKSRDRFKHLTETTPCVCGAGRDVSFLYDVLPKEDKRPKTDQFDPTEVRMDEEENEKPKKKSIQLPDTLIPAEYHIVKNKGVLGLEYYEDEFATQPTDHEAHLVLFPSMTPASRYEVMQLKKTMSDMLSHAGLDDDDFHLDGPTQMHNFLELIKKEQDIYNIVFHELIRQVSIECVERGELLSDVRGRYSHLVGKIPRQIKGLHEEVLAQRALDRRLTEELMRFKNKIGILTSELTAVKEHDRMVTAEAKDAQEGLKSALAESQRNSSLLQEYHDLYELQRRRLEQQVTVLTDEKEIWSTASYSLALKVTKEHSLNTARRLNVSEKSWVKLANHFSILLSDKDTDILTQLQTYVDKWRDLVVDFYHRMKQREEEMREKVRLVRSGVQHWINYFQRNVLSKDGHFQKAPDVKKITFIYEDIKKFEQILATQNDLFGGDVLLSGQEQLFEISYQVGNWTDCAILVFNRHRGENGETHPDHQEMLAVNEEIEILVEQCTIRLTGENGSAVGLINTANSMEQWDSKFTALLHGNNPLPEQDWLRFYNCMDDWVQHLDDTLQNIGSTQKEDDKFQHLRVDVIDTVRRLQWWLASSTNNIDSEDAKLVEAVTTLHTDMIKWMVQLLLRLAPDREDHSKEARDSILMGSATITQIELTGKELFKTLHTFTRHVTTSCSSIVAADMQTKLTAQDDDAELESKELQRLQTVCDEWISTAKLLLEELLQKCSAEVLETTQPELPAPVEQKADVVPVPAEESIVFHDKEKLAPSKPQERPPPMGGPSLSTTGVETLEVIGGDENTHTKTVDSLQKNASASQAPTVAEAPDTKKAYEALAAINSLQDQLVNTEERAQMAESRKSELEAEVKEQQETIRALERAVAALEAGKEPKPISAPSVKTTPPSTDTTKVATNESTPSVGASKADPKSSTSRTSSRTSSRGAKKK